MKEDELEHLLIFGVKTRYFEEKSLKTGNFTCSLEYGTALTTIIFSQHFASKKFLKKFKFVNIIYEMSVFLNTVVEAFKQISDFFLSIFY
jgi:hypothetical protein